MLPIKYVFFIKYVVSSNVFYEIIKHAVNSNLLGDRDIFIFDGGNKRLRNVTNLYCQCQISQRRS
jgi:hypothetical protein